MKKLLLLSLVFANVGAHAFQAGPISPMRDYNPSTHTMSEVMDMWNTMDKDVKGKDCYKRAHVWAWDMYKNYGAMSTKVFIHYTDKWNNELDAHARSRSNKTWDYHVAPGVRLDNGEVMVLDGHVGKIPLQPVTITEWVDFLSARGEYLLKERQTELLKDLNRFKRKLSRTRSSGKIRKYTDRIASIRATMAKIGVTEDPNQYMEIKCKKITHIMDFDLGQFDEWCYYSEAPMYYWNQIGLRLLNLGGDLGGYSARAPITDPRVYTEDRFANGEAYLLDSWNMSLLEQSTGEMKRRSSREFR